MFTVSTTSLQHYALSPQPSGQTGKKIKRSRSLAKMCERTRDQYDRMILEQANTPMGRKNPDELLEVMTRKRNQELELENAEQAEELQQLWIQNDEILDELQTTKHDFTTLGKNYNALNQTLQDFQMGINNTTVFADETVQLNFQDHERATIAEMKENIREQQAKIAYSDSAMICMKADYNIQYEEAQAKIHTLQFQLNETAQALQESEETITENMNLNKTISEEKTRFTILSEEYREKVQEYNTKIAKIEAEKEIQYCDYQENMESLRTDISKNNDNLSYWKKQAERRSTELNIISKKLNRERAQRSSSATLYRKTSINLKVLTKKNQKTEAERDQFFEENEGLQRELAQMESRDLESRMQIRKYEERKKLSSAQKLFGKCFGKYRSSDSQD